MTFIDKNYKNNKNVQDMFIEKLQQISDKT